MKVTSSITNKLVSSLALKDSWITHLVDALKKQIQQFVPMMNIRKVASALRPVTLSTMPMKLQEPVKDASLDVKYAQMEIVAYNARLEKC